MASEIIEGGVVWHSVLGAIYPAEHSKLMRMNEAWLRTQVRMRSAGLDHHDLYSMYARLYWYAGAH